MKLHIQYTPTDPAGKAYNLSQNYTVADLQRLVDDVTAGLAASGQPATAVLTFEIDLDGTLHCFTDATVATQ